MTFFDLKSLFSIQEIEWWLLKYSDLYKECKDTYDAKHSDPIFRNDDGSVIRLPSMGNPSYIEKVLDLYEALDTLTEYHKDEQYFEQELVEYQKIKSSKPNLKKWVAKNESLGADKYICFLIEYLDYDKDGQEEHLKVSVYTSKEIEIYINRQDFKNTIDFLEIFNELFWRQEIYPESSILTRIEKEMNENKGKLPPTTLI